MKSNLAQCANCNASINHRVQECPWCGAVQPLLMHAPMRKRLSLGALITISTLAALYLWLVWLSQRT
ncbi:hypothetical protein NHH03_12050 [Stieleria sp. TO1_6]|uniref:hypothetical protein n=1 Tax=Stieleria tagensis TaxID=2956795 RepID=UPI00209B871E|nr:hypothetical protein [Stieleria tagensis]MCO8122471.1 hypothetical protein [Stieleria tagensis]